MKKFKETLGIAIVLIVVMVGSYKVMYHITLFGFKFVSKVLEALKKYLVYIKKYITKSTTYDEADEDLERV